MIITVSEAREALGLPDWSDARLEMKLRAIEQTVRAYTNNNFHAPGARVLCDVKNGAFRAHFENPLSQGDAFEIGTRYKNAGLYTVAEIAGLDFCTAEIPPANESCVIATKIVYPADVRSCCMDLLSWEQSYRAKVGVQSETLSRHSVTYFKQGAGEEIMGYPAALLGCLRAYRRTKR